MKSLPFLALLLFLLSFAFTSANACTNFCVDEGYTYGACRETSESKGFCEGKDEEVYSFSPCTNFKRCCCGNETVSLEEASDVEESLPVANVSEEVSSQAPFVLGDFAQNIFLALLLLVAVLGLAVLVKKKAFSEEEKKD